MMVCNMTHIDSEGFESCRSHRTKVAPPGVNRMPSYKRLIIKSSG